MRRRIHACPCPCASGSGSGSGCGFPNDKHTQSVTRFQGVTRMYPPPHMTHAHAKRHVMLFASHAKHRWSVSHSLTHSYTHTVFAQSRAANHQTFRRSGLEQKQTQKRREGGWHGREGVLGGGGGRGRDRHTAGGSGCVVCQCIDIHRHTHRHTYTYTDVP